MTPRKVLFLVQTNHNNGGLTDELADRVIEILGRVAA